MSSTPKSLRTFSIVWVTQAISTFGSALTFFSIQFWLVQGLYPRPEQQADLAWALTAISLAQGLPALLVTPLAGVWADRHDRRRIMLWMNLACFALTIGLAGLLLADALRLGALLGIVMLSTLFNTARQAALAASITMIVPPDQLPRANGMMAMLLSLSGILSPGLAALLLALPAVARAHRWLPDILGRLHDGMPVAVGLDAFSFLVAAIALLRLQIPMPAARPAVASVGPSLVTRARRFLGEAWEGGRFIWRRPRLAGLLSLLTLASIAMTPLILYQPILVKRALAGDWARHGMTYEAALGFLNAIGSLGGVLGGVAISLWGARKQQHLRGVLLAVAVTGLAQVAFGLSPWLALSAAMLFVVYGMGPISGATAQAIWQIETPPELQGRVFAIQGLISQAAWPIGSLLSGWLGGLIRPGLVIAAAGGLLALLCQALALHSGKQVKVTRSA